MFPLFLLEKDSLVRSSSLLLTDLSLCLSEQKNKMTDMRTKFNFKRLTSILLIAAFVLTASSELKAQEKKSSDLKNFTIIVEKTENGIKMQSAKGTAWIDLSFSLNNYQSQAVDEYGMTKLN